MSSLFDFEIDDLTAQLCEALAALPMDRQVAALNRTRRALHETGPFRDQPVDCVLWVEADTVQPNDYNPNHVAPPEMRMLKRSIRREGYTQPIVGWDSGTAIEVVDGEHRTRVGREDAETRTRLYGYLPVTLINAGRDERSDRIAATILHNEARGKHGVRPMAEIVAELLRSGWADDDVARELGMDADEVLRFKHTTGLPDLFKNGAYSQAWE